MMKRACLVISTSISVLCDVWVEQNAEPKVKVGEGTFKCITDMTPVRHFYVDNLLGNLQGTVAVAEEDMGAYPEASVYSRSRPTEVMIKQQKGLIRRPATGLFAIDVSKDGSNLINAGFEKRSDPLRLEPLRVPSASTTRV